MTVAILFIAFALIILMGGPIGSAMGTSSLLSLIVDGSSLNMVPYNFYASLNKFVLLAIPFFILGGNIMERAGISNKLIDFAQSLVGHIRGGMGMVCVIVSCFFAAISGSGPATVAALGMIIIPAMVKVGYPAGAAAALMATAGSIGVIIPPSISFVNYSSITGESTGKLFMAGIIPGLMMGLSLILACAWVVRKVDLVRLPKASAKERWHAFIDAFWGLMMPVIILGGIYGGIFTPTEAAAVSAVYGLLVGFFIYRTLHIKDLIPLFVTSMKQSGAVMLCVAMGNLFSWVLMTEGVTNKIVDWIINVSNGNIIIFMLIVNITLLIAGCIIDGVAAIYIFTPLFLPVAKALGYDPLVLGVVIVMNLAIGMVTPPVGCNLYVAAAVSGIKIKEIIRYVWPFAIASIIVLLLVTYIQPISQLLPTLVK